MLLPGLCDILLIHYVSNLLLNRPLMPLCSLNFIDILLDRVVIPNFIYWLSQLHIVYFHPRGGIHFGWDSLSWFNPGLFWYRYRYLSSLVLPIIQDCSGVVSYFRFDCCFHQTSDVSSCYPYYYFTLVAYLSRLSSMDMICFSILLVVVAISGPLYL